ncbi:hypothetical protein ACJIZ3_003725 [Penstemon smallii]|uniref:Uncharacterized protein n=1 Tax=Penstemon smallii TaxID=265156 RepID=A0ABD3UDG4_9LAMI
MSFLNLMLQEANLGNVGDVEKLTGACQRISAALNSQFNRRFSLFSLKKKVEWFRHRNNIFDKFLHTPGVWYDTQNSESHEETPLFREFRLNGNPYHLKLSHLYDVVGVASFPKDLTGSPEWPIHIRDSDDDEKAVVPYAGPSGCLPPLPNE